MSIRPRAPRSTPRSTPRSSAWRADDSLAIVEDIPARVCNLCLEQYYDEDVSDALRLLMEAGFPVTEAKKVITVPVFSLDGRIRARVELPEDTYLD